MVSEKYLGLLKEIQGLGVPPGKLEDQSAMEQMHLYYSGVAVAVRQKLWIAAVASLESLSYQAYGYMWRVFRAHVSWGEVFAHAAELHVRKNAGYAGAGNPDPWANFRMCEELGVPAWLGCLVRMSDKFIRVENLLKDPDNERVGEGIADTLADLGAYALIAVCLIEEMLAGREI